ncbi:hypothetical protein TorRG33x02_267760, partial [Trema orientale]
RRGQLEDLRPAGEVREDYVAVDLFNLIIITTVVFFFSGGGGGGAGVEVWFSSIDHGRTHEA